MHRSIFSYNITKPYPYPWFTWIVITGGLIATALLTAMNLAANGYEPSVVYQSNLSAIEHSNVTAWYERRPWSVASKVNTKCQDQVLQIGSKFHTDSGLFQYEILRVEQTDSKSRRLSTSFAYHGEVLEECEMMRFRMGTTATKRLDIQAMFDCTVYHDDIRTVISLSLRSTGSSSTFTTLQTGKLAPEAITRSLEWISGMLIEYISMQHELKQQYQYYWANFKVDSPVDHSNIVAANLVRNVPGALGPVISFMGYMDLGFRLSAEDLPTWIVPDQIPYSEDDPKEKSSIKSWSQSFGAELSAHFDNEGNFTSSSDDASTTVTIDYMVKVFQSLVLSDLGQTTDSNIFAKPRLFWESSRAIDDWFPGYLTNGSLGLNGTQGPFSFDDTTRNDPACLYRYMGWQEPSVRNVQIKTLYLCQIPRPKSAPARIITVLVADFVFLSALWTIFSWFCTGLLKRYDPDANVCVGCALRPDNPVYFTEDEISTTSQSIFSCRTLRDDSSLSGGGSFFPNHWYGQLKDWCKLRTYPGKVHGNRSAKAELVHTTTSLSFSEHEFRNFVGMEHKIRESDSKIRLGEVSSFEAGSPSIPQPALKVSLVSNRRGTKGDDPTFWEV